MTTGPSGDRSEQHHREHGVVDDGRIDMHEVFVHRLGVGGAGDEHGRTGGTDDVLFRSSSTGDLWFEAISNGAFNGWHQVVMNTEGQSRAMRNVAFLD